MDPIEFIFAFFSAFSPFFLALWRIIYKLHKDTDGKIEKLNDKVGKEISQLRNEFNTLKNKVETVGEEFDTLAGEVGKETAELKIMVGDVGKETAELKIMVGDVGKETAELKERLDEVEGLLKKSGEILTKSKNKD